MQFNRPRRRPVDGTARSSEPLPPGGRRTRREQRGDHTRVTPGQASLATTGFIVAVPYMQTHALRDAPISIDR